MTNDKVYLKDHLASAESDVREVIMKLADVTAKISRGFAERQGKAGSKNVYGEEQVAMDVWADTLIIEEMKKSGMVSYLASEEQPDVLKFEGATSDIGITIDPLDGSSLIGVNLTVGTIVGIFRGDVMSKGTGMIGAMYVLYGPLTTLTYTLRNGVHEFVLTPEGEFVLQEENIRIPEGKIFAPGALRKDYLPNHMRFIEKLEEDGYKIRFSGSFVADVHQILHKGGVFTYPGFRGKEIGKLRLLFEAFPMGFIVDQAGGRISDGKGNTLEITPEAVSQRVPIYVGGKKEIGIIESLNREE